MVWIVEKVGSSGKSGKQWWLATACKIHKTPGVLSWIDCGSTPCFVTVYDNDTHLE